MSQEPESGARSFSDLQQMLSLSMIAYEGHSLWRGARDHDAEVARLVRGAIAKREPVRDRFQLVWGPATYRPSFGLFDDAMMYVVRDEASPGRYAVVVRGTNSLSLTDWLFGDAWADRTVPWPHSNAEEGARVSLSTSLGLSILQSLRAEPLGPLSFGFETAVLRAGVNALFEPVAEAVRGPLHHLRDRVHALSQALLPEPVAEGGDWAAAILRRRSSAAWAEIRKTVAEAMDAAAGHVQFNLYRFLEKDSRAQSQNQPTSAIDLATFLRSVTDAGDADIWVTGHSKGGMVASALGLWLADTQGQDLPEEEQWDPERRARIHTMSFGAPAAGNEPFCARASRAFGDRARRVANESDIATLGWNADSMLQIPSIYGDRAEAPRALRELVVALADEVRPLGYQHIGGRVISFDAGFQDTAPTFAGQASYQHAPAYLAWAGLSRSSGA
jgi:hypothetical protein